MYQAEKGHSMLQRLKAYKAQLERQASPLHGSPFGQYSDMDQRDYGVGAQILRDLGVCKIRLITRSKKRRIGLIGYGLEIVDVINY